MNLIKLNKYLEFNNRRINLLRKEKDRLPKGSLIINNREEGTFFYSKVNGRARGITREPARIIELARSKYLGLILEKYRLEQLLIKQVLTNKELAKLNKKIDQYLDKYRNIKIIDTEVCLNSKQLKWRDHQSDNSDYYPESLIHVSKRGIKLRSMAELIIANSMEERNIPYRYEFCLELDVTLLVNQHGYPPKGARHRQGRWYKKYYPDFVIMLADGSFIIWEHFGKPDDDNYRRENAEKFCAYAANGYLNSGSLIVTFPDDVKNNMFIQDLLDECIMPYL